MSKAVKPIPDGYHVVTPYLRIRGAAKAIDWYKNVFGATEFVRMPEGPDRIGHAELRIGDSVVMLSDEYPNMGVVSPQTLGGCTAALLLYVQDADAILARAVAAGAKVTVPMQDMFYGDRSCRIEDPFGHAWMISTHIEDVTPEEMKRRMAAMSAKP